MGTKGGAKGFDKFINKDVSNAKKKEAFKQQKRKAKAAARERGNEERRRRRDMMIQSGQAVRGWRDEMDAYRQNKRGGAPKKQQEENDDNWRPSQKLVSEIRNFDKDKFLKNGKNPDTQQRLERGAKQYGKYADKKSNRSFDKKSDSYSDRTERSFGSDKRERFDRNDKTGRSFDKPNRSNDKFDRSSDRTERSFGSEKRERFDRTNDRETFRVKDNFRAKKSSFQPAIIENKEEGFMALNKFVAHSGVCGRREAVELIKEGVIKVNDQVVNEPGFKVNSGADTVTFKGRKLFIQKNLVYILLNKPKDHLTTLDDPQGRRTVFDLIKNATEERVYPVGRLDRNTTGVLLLTNDGELAQKLTHPKFQIQKIYEVKLDKPVTKKDAESIVNGLTLEDGFIQADAVGFPDPKDKSIVGVEIHSGRNRIVRRIFEHLGYDVKNLDRVMFANLTKKNVERSHWRYLSEKEVRLLKYLNKSLVKKQNSKDAK